MASASGTASTGSPAWPHDPQLYSDSFQVPNGGHELCFFAVDVAGNAEDGGTRTAGTSMSTRPIR